MENLYITSPHDVPMGEVVERVLNIFATGLPREVRDEFLSVALHKGAYRLESWEFDEFPEKLHEVCSRIWLREMTAGYLELIWMLVNKLEGRGTMGSGIISGKEAEQQLVLMTAWIPLWISSKEIRDKAYQLIKTLEQAMYWFNFQWVAVKFYSTHTTHDCNFDLFCKGISDKDRISQCHALENYAYMHGKEHFFKWHRAYEELMVADGPEELKGLFAINYEQLTQMAHMRMGGKVSLEQFCAAGSKEETDTGTSEEQEIRDLWMEQNGILVPNTQ